MNAINEPTVSMIHPQAWGNERLEMLPYDSLIEEGRYVGGHVLMLHAEGTTQLWAIPPEVIVLLEGILPDDQYRKLLSPSPHRHPGTG